MISEETNRGLMLLGSKELGAAAGRIVDTTFDIVIGKATPVAILEGQGLAKLDRILLKQCHAALCSAILCSARADADAETFQSTLEDAGVPPQVAAAASSRYEKEKTSLRGVLGGISGLRPPQIVDITWRLDYYMRSSVVERINKPIYFIRLETRTRDGQPGSLEFAATVEELQDLIARLRDAAKQSERTAALLA